MEKGISVSFIITVLITTYFSPAVAAEERDLFKAVEQSPS